MGVSLLLVFTHVFTFVGTGTTRPDPRPRHLLDLLRRRHRPRPPLLDREAVRGGGRRSRRFADRRARPRPPAAPDPGDRRLGGGRLRHLDRRLRHQPVALERRRDRHRADQDLHRHPRGAAPVHERDRDDHDGPHACLGHGSASSSGVRSPAASGARATARTSQGPSTEVLRDGMARGDIRLIELSKRFADVTAVDASTSTSPAASSSRCSARPAAARRRRCA